MGNPYNKGLKDNGAGRRTVYSLGKSAPKVTTKQGVKVMNSAGKSQPSYDGNVDPKSAPVWGDGVK